ncbi:TIMELESS-interacting protein [Hydra vulgaris]|uniref:TIMELESS-interacting protein n=1 Tax=Hydra vulgaris TaxID=6087 RepID=UPI001F5FC6AA|nr:TIMELESS-interacting protein [Hydra vulgaris]
MISDEENQLVVDENPVNAEDLFGEDLETSTANKEAGVTTAEQKKKRIINRLPPLNQAWLLDEKHEGISKVNSYFKGIKLKSSRGHELANLKVILKRYEYWAQQCYPKLCFQDFVEKVEMLSGKKEIRNFLQQNRNENQNTPDSLLTNKLSLRTDSEILFGGDSPQKLNQPIVTPDESFLITEDLRQTISRKREEAIAKRKLKLEQSMNQPSEENASNFTNDGAHEDLEIIHGDDLVIDTEY